MIGLHFFAIARIGKSIERESVLVIAGAGEREKGGEAASEVRVSFWSDKNALEHFPDSRDGCISLRMY